MLLPLIFLISFSSMFIRLLLLKVISPLSVDAKLLGNKPIIDNAVIDLPDPDSPTIAKVLPGSRSNDIPSTAFTIEFPTVKCVFKFFTLSSFSLLIFCCQVLVIQKNYCSCIYKIFYYHRQSYHL